MRLVAGLEVEDPTFPASVAAATSKRLATFERTQEDEFLRRWDIEGFGVCLLCRQGEVGRDAQRDRMPGGHRPYLRRPSIFAPSPNTAGRAQQGLEDARTLAGVQRGLSFADATW